jgi:hypothetical protein
MLHSNQFLLCGDEDGTIQSNPPLLSGSLHDVFPPSIVGDGLYVSDLIHRFGDLFLSPSKSVSKALGGVYLFNIRLMNLFYMSQWLSLWLSLIRW